MKCSVNRLLAVNRALSIHDLTVSDPHARAPCSP